MWTINNVSCKNWVKIFSLFFVPGVRFITIAFWNDMDMNCDYDSENICYLSLQKYVFYEKYASFDNGLNYTKYSKIHLPYNTIIND